MKEKEFIQKYNGLQASKKSSVTIALIYGICSLIAFIAVLIWAYGVHQSSVNEIKVVDKVGNVLNSSTVRKDKLIKSLIEAQCATTVYYANSFDNLTLKENQARTLFLMNQTDARKIFETYKENNQYHDALQRGYDFETEYLEMKDFDSSKEPFEVSFISKLKISQGDKAPSVYYIVSHGQIITHTPQYPENPYGYYFKSYSQEFKQTENE